VTCPRAGCRAAGRVWHARSQRPGTEPRAPAAGPKASPRRRLPEGAPVCARRSAYAGSRRAQPRLMAITRPDQPGLHDVCQNASGPCVEGVHALAAFHTPLDVPMPRRTTRRLHAHPSAAPWISTIAVIVGVATVTARRRRPRLIRPTGATRCAGGSRVGSSMPRLPSHSPVPSCCSVFVWMTCSRSRGRGVAVCGVAHHADADGRHRFVVSARAPLALTPRDVATRLGTRSRATTGNHHRISPRGAWQVASWVTP
jgi:hypothetical protein